MSRSALSPVKRWPGYVVISDPLSFPQLIKFREALETASREDSGNWLAANYAVLPGLLACVEEVHLQGIPEGKPVIETWPATPPVSAAKLIAWLIDEINALMVEAEPDPND